MAALVPTFQKFIDLPDGRVLGVTKVKLVSTSDTITVPKPASTSANVSAAGLRGPDDAACTVTQSGNTVTLAGTAGQEITVTTLHRPFVNSGFEA